MRQTLKTIASRTGLLPPARFLIQQLRKLSPRRAAKARRLQARRQKLQDLYGQWVQPNDLCFDIGANVGARVEMFRRLGARVVAAEPHEICLRALREKFDRDPRVALVPKGLGAEPGELELFISNDIQTSSMSKDWIESVADRLPGHSWQESKMVEITTLDHLIETHGRPQFCKIDVEGFEHEVLKGLSEPIPFLSFEYTPERLGPALACLERLDQLGPYRFNYSAEEDFEMVLSPWASRRDLERTLERLSGSHRSGDIYARLVDDGSEHAEPG